jgi:hypothetical protein
MSLNEPITLTDGQLDALLLCVYIALVVAILHLFKDLL